MAALSGFFIVGIVYTIWFLCLIFLIILAIDIVINYIFDNMFLYNKYKSYKVLIPYYNKIYLGLLINNKIIGKIICILDILITIIIILFIIIDFSLKIKLFILLIIIVLFLITYILNIVLSHKIMKTIKNKKIVIYTIINILTLNLSRGIILFILRKKIRNVN